MAGIRSLLRHAVSRAITETFGPEYGGIDPLIQVTQPPHFGDFQANFALSLAKTLKKNPKEVAAMVAERLKNQEYCEEIQVSGPGFLNIRLTQRILETQLTQIQSDSHLGVESIASPQKVIVEYSSPNVAKEMHVGHLRSAIIGDAIARIMQFIGHEVIRQNHIGDWGTQFGMLIQYMQETNWEMQPHHSMSEISQLYRKAKERFDADADFADNARKQVVALQSGDPAALKRWEQLVSESTEYFQQIYQRLGLQLTPNDVRGESFYNPMLAKIIEEFRQKQLLVESEGALTIFLPGFVDKNNKPLPLIIQKTGGGYLYATTDLAAVKFRIEQIQAQRVIYVVDARQAQHFAMVFAAAEAIGWNAHNVQLHHAAFGTVLGKDRKPFKTRSGETVPLVELLEEAEKRASAIIANKTEFDDVQKQQIAHTIGVAALKYGDLSTDKIKDYVFDLDRMLAFEGNTAPYLLNAYVRIRAIFRKGNIDPDTIVDSIHLSNDYERALGLKLLEFSELIPSITEDLAIHRLCNYLYDLASAFHKFYEHCPVLGNTDPVVQQSRLALCLLTSKTLHTGLGLLGIETLEQM